MIFARILAVFLLVSTAVCIALFMITQDVFFKRLAKRIFTVFCVIALFLGLLFAISELIPWDALKFN